MLAPRIQEQIRQLVDAEFEHRSRTLPQTVEAKLRRLVADRGHGGHLTIEISELLAREFRERIQAWATIILRVLHAEQVKVSASLVSDFRSELQGHAARDHETALAAMKAKYSWLELKEEKIEFARNNEVEKQVAIASLYPNEGAAPRSTSRSIWWRLGGLIAGAVAFVASAVAILEYLGITLWR